MLAQPSSNTSGPPSFSSHDASSTLDSSTALSSDVTAILLRNSKTHWDEEERQIRENLDFLQRDFRDQREMLMLGRKRNLIVLKVYEDLLKDEPVKYEMPEVIREAVRRAPEAAHLVLVEAAKQVIQYDYHDYEKSHEDGVKERVVMALFEHLDAMTPEGQQEGSSSKGKGKARA